MFYEFVHDLGDVQGVTLMALFADLRVFNDIVNEHGGEDALKAQARVIMDDYVVDGNTYEMDSNEVIEMLRALYNQSTGEFLCDLSQGTLFDELYEFCVGAL